MGNYKNVFPRKLPPKLSKAQSNIPNLQNVRDHLLFSFEENLLNGEEFIHLYDINTSKNPDFPRWRFDPFDLDELLDDKCKKLKIKIKIGKYFKIDRK